jgi:predicted Ser/Thr protein kinase
MSGRAASVLGAVVGDVRREFEANRRLLSFEQFVDVVLEHPTRHIRSAAQYLHDCIHYFGVEEREYVWGKGPHYKLFDVPFDGGRERMIGQSRAQQRVMRLIEAFVRSGRVDKLVLLHGPNGSAKSTFIRCIMHALEVYSETDEGALYRFNWIFPVEALVNGSGIGFGSKRAQSAGVKLDTYAFLEPDQISARLTGSLHDHPLMLLPAPQRQRLIEQALEGRGDFVVSEQLLRGDMSHTNRQIFDALLTGYRGDMAAVLKHVQVERFFVSRRYRRGAVTVEPQMRVDAGLRQLTADRSLGQLPPSLHNQTLFEPFGDLVDANRGVIEYDDMFRRHPDLNRYLLSAAERGAVALDDRILYLDLVLLATGNDDYLDAFKQGAEYAAFKGRTEFVRLPYLLDYTQEQSIYDEQLERVKLGKHIAPHTTRIAALWAVLTRMRRPNAELYPATLREVIAKLTPLDKAMLYAHAQAPEGLAPERARELVGAIGALMDETDGAVHYEGRHGASPREMKMVLLNAAQNEAFESLSPLAVLTELEGLVRDPSVFPFLQIKPEGDYHRPDNFITTVREHYLDLVDAEVQDAMGLVEERQYAELFTRYIDHVHHWLRGEKITNAITGRAEVADERFMGEIEALLGTATADKEQQRTMRAGLINQIAAFSIDNPGEKVDYKRIFPTQLDAIRRSFFEERVKVVRRAQQAFLVYCEEGAGGLSAQEAEQARVMLDNMIQRYGYNKESAREAVAALSAARYKQA